MLAFLNLSHHPRRTFRRHFLSSVHCEFRFTSELDVERLLGKQEELQAALGRLGFPEVRQVFEGQFTFDARSDRMPKLSQQASPIGLLFVSQSPNRSVQLGHDRLIVSDHAYDGFESFLVRIRTYWEIVSQLMNMSQSVVVQKVGLRKVNSIAVEPVSSLQSALSVFNPALFGVARSGLFKTETFKGTEEVSALETKDGLCVLRSKLQRRSDTSLEANLDFDFVSLEATDFQKSFSEILPNLNDAHFDVFMWAITDELVSLMQEG